MLTLAVTVVLLSSPHMEMPQHGNHNVSFFTLMSRFDHERGVEFMYIKISTEWLHKRKKIQKLSK